jgi:hypothetical protein
MQAKKTFFFAVVTPVNRVKGSGFETGVKVKATSPAEALEIAKISFRTYAGDGDVNLDVWTRKDYNAIIQHITLAARDQERASRKPVAHTVI